MKFEIDEELWYGASSDEQAEARAAKSMAARMGRIIGAKPFPAAAHRLSLITQDPNCLMDEVVSVLESDPALSARLLRLVNSVGFSLRTACTSVRHAATLVGTEKLNQVASTAAILDMYESSNELTMQLLEHATVVGALCRYLAFHFGLPPDELFTCGFLHDIGKLMLLDTEGDEYLELLGREKPQFDTLFVEERQHFGFDHALLAGHVLAAWNIPHPVPKVVAWHHHVTRAYAESTEISQLVSTLRLADAMSFALQAEDREAEIRNLAKTEAASYMDISEGQLAAMWDEVKALTERARAVFRGEKIEEPDTSHTSRPSAASLRAVAKAKNSERTGILTTSIAPALSERPRQFPCVVCDAPSYAHKCAACHGYTCPLHISGDDDWCQLCQKAYAEEGIPHIRPVVSTLLGAALGALLAAAFFGAASAGAQRPMKLMIGPTLFLMLVGMLFGVGHRWVRRWWFLRTRPNRASVLPLAVENVLDVAQKQAPLIVEVGAEAPPEPVPASPLDEPQPRGYDPELAQAPEQTAAAVDKDGALSLSHPEFPASPALPSLDAPTSAPEPPPEVPKESPVIHGLQLVSPRRALHWMSNVPRTPRPAVTPSETPAEAPLPEPAPEAEATFADSHGDESDRDAEPMIVVSGQDESSDVEDSEFESWEAIERELDVPTEGLPPSPASLPAALLEAAVDPATATELRPTTHAESVSVAEPMAAPEPLVHVAEERSVSVPRSAPEVNESAPIDEVSPMSDKFAEASARELSSPPPPSSRGRTNATTEARVKRSRARGRASDAAQRSSEPSPERAVPAAASRPAESIAHRPATSAVPAQRSSASPEVALRPAAAVSQSPTAVPIGAIVMQQPAPAAPEPSAARPPAASPATAVALAAPVPDSVAVASVPESAVVAVGERAREGRESGWKDVLDGDGTAAGW